MKRPSPMLRGLASQLIEQELRHRTAPQELGAALERCYQRLYGALVNLVGEAGFQALMSRAAHITGSEFDWLEEALSPASASAAIKELHELARVKEAPLSVAGMTVLLANVFELLCAFIGEELTLRLVRRTWTEVEAPEPGLKEGQ